MNLLVFVLEVLGCARGLVADAVAVVWEHHEGIAGDAADDGRQHGHDGPLAGLHGRVKARHRVPVQQRQGGEHHERQRRVHEVSGAEAVPGQVPSGSGIRVDGEGAHPAARDDAVVHPAVGADVAVGEGREGAEAAAKRHERTAEDLVVGGAVAVVGDERAEELEHEHRAARQQLDQVGHPTQRALRHTHAPRRRCRHY
ncbi:unnamed protein product [Alopecurus aequalis]